MILHRVPRCNAFRPGLRFDCVVLFAFPSSKRTVHCERWSKVSGNRWWRVNWDVATVIDHLSLILWSRVQETPRAEWIARMRVRHIWARHSSEKFQPFRRSRRVVWPLRASFCVFRLQISRREGSNSRREWSLIKRYDVINSYLFHDIEIACKRHWSWMCAFAVVRHFVWSRGEINLFYSARISPVKVKYTRE